MGVSLHRKHPTKAMLREGLPWCRRDIGSDEWFGRTVDPTPGPLQDVQSTLWR